MAKKADFNLSEVIRERRKTHRKEKATEALAAIKKAHPTQKINDGTFKSTFYKLVGGSGKKRTVRRLKPGARGEKEGSGIIAQAVAFVRSAGSIGAARQALDELEAAVREL
jgi:hypothetical protein